MLPKKSTKKTVLTMAIKNKKIRFELSLKLGSLFRKKIMMERIINQSQVEKKRDTLQLIIALPKGCRTNELLKR